MMNKLKPDYPIALLSETLSVARSSYYYESQTRSENDVVAAVEQDLMRHPFHGYRRVTAQLQREGWAVGTTRIRRILKQLGHTRSVGKVTVRTTDSSHSHLRYPNRIRGLTPTRPDQVWVADITYIRHGYRFWYLAIILDACTRLVRGWALRRSLERFLALDALRMALTTAVPLIFHSDQGVQYACYEHTDLLTVHGVTISMSDSGQPTQNGMAERFMRTLKEEHVDYSDYDNFDDAQQQLAIWLMDIYNTQRIHSALDYQTPTEFEALALAKNPYPLLN
jgi:putative transposase